jgi:hypothetical protein
MGDTFTVAVAYRFTVLRGRLGSASNLANGQTSKLISTGSPRGRRYLEPRLERAMIKIYARLSTD